MNRLKWCTRRATYTEYHGLVCISLAPQLDLIFSLRVVYLTFILDVPCTMCVPNCLVRRQVLVPMLYAVGGTILATQLAYEHGWAINLSGGYIFLLNKDILLIAFLGIIMLRLMREEAFVYTLISLSLFGLCNRNISPNSTKS